MVVFMTGCPALDSLLDVEARLKPDVSDDVRGLPTSSAYHIVPNSGAAPFTFEMISGPGSVTPSGVYSSNLTKGTVVIKVTDAVGVSTMKSLEVVDPITLAPAPGTVAAFTNLTISPSGGSGSGFILTIDSIFSNFWSSITNTLTRPWSSGNFSVVVKDSLGFTQSFNYTLNPSSIIFPGVNSYYNYFNTPIYDTAGNIFHTGYFNGPIGTLATTSAPVSVFILNMNAEGSIIWSRVIEGTAGCYTPSADVKVTNNFLYVPIACYGPGDFNGITLAPNQTLYSVSKIRKSDGSDVWVKSIPYILRRLSLDTDSAENVFIAGVTTAGVFGAAAPGGQDNFLAKFDPAGTLSWVHYAGAGTSYISGINVQADDSVYLYGSSDGQVIPGSSNPSSLRQPYVIKYLADGTRSWAYQVPTTAGWQDYTFTSNLFNGYSSSKARVLNGKSVFCGTQMIWPSYQETSPFVSIYSASGSLIAFREFLPSSADVAGAGKCVLTNDAIYIAFVSSTAYGSLANTDHDLVVIKVDFSGNEIWARKFDIKIPFESLSGSLISADNYENKAYFFLAGIADFDANGSTESDVVQVKVQPDGVGVVSIAGFNFLPTQYSYPYLSVNPVDGKSYGSIYGGELIIDGINIGNYNGSALLKFNSSFQRQ